MLRADALALAAADAVAGFAEAQRQAVIILALRRPALAFDLLQLGVIQREIFGDGDVPRAAVGAVGAARAGDGDGPVDNVHRLFHKRLLGGVKRAQLRHVAHVVLHLRQRAHAAQNDHDVVQAGRKADGPGRHRQIGMVGAEHRLDGFGHLGQRAALDRLHDNDRLAVLDGGLIALAGLHAFAVPVQIVQLQLHELHLRVFGQHAVQQLGVVVEREADVPHQALGLFLLQPGKAVQLGVDLVVVGADVVQQVIVKILDAGLAALLVKDAVAVLFGFQEPGVQLVRQREAVARVAADQRVFDGALALEAAVHPGGVKVGKAARQESVDHLLELLDVDAGVHIGVGQGQAHQAKAQFFARFEIHDRSLRF